MDKFLTENVTENVKESGTWIRFAAMVFYGVAFYIVSSLTFFIAAVQFLIKLLTGSVNTQLQSVGLSLALYAKESIVFLTFHSEELPFPFGLAWPKGEKEKPAPKSTRKPAKKSSAKSRAKSQDKSQARKAAA
jgi:hypothetical protein